MLRKKLYLKGVWNTFRMHINKHFQYRLKLLYRRLAMKPVKKVPYDTFYYCCTQKTASQWLRKILEDPVIYKYTGLQSWPYIRLGLRHANRPHPPPAGTFATHYYIDYPTFQDMLKPDNYRAFFILRDPRDVVVSWYYSARYSHPYISVIPEMREKLLNLDQKEGMKYIIDKIRDFGTFDAQVSWINSSANDPNTKIFRYEDLASNQEEFIKTLFRFLEIDIPDIELDELLAGNRFDQLNRGRQKGQEDIYSHNRKGISGDWTNYFDKDIENYFLERTGNLLDILGYQ